jgi:Tripartite tricarboxylate transporter family receptor
MIKSRVTRRQFSTALAAAAAGMFPRSAPAQQNYPSRPVRFILPFAAAGVADITSRIAAEKLGDKLGQRFVVENQPGPGGIAAARAVLSQAPDGYTLGLVTNGTSISAAIYKALPFDPVTQFATISTIGAFDLVFASNADAEFKTLADFIKGAREQPGKLNVGTINVGGTQNLAAELLKSSAGLNFQIIPYRGTPDVIVALLRNDVQLMVLCRDEADAAGQEDARDRHLRPPALAVLGRRAHRRGSGRCGIRGDVLERAVCARRHPAGDHRPVEQGDTRDRGDARREAALRRPRDRSQGQHAGGVEGAAHGRHRQVGGGDRARRHREAIAPPRSGRLRGSRCRYCGWIFAHTATSGLVAARLAGQDTDRSLARVTAALPGPQ